MTFVFTSTLISWRGPAPFVFAPVPPEICAEIQLVARRITYGWGVIPAEVAIGQTRVTTSLFPRHGGYLVPIKVALQRAEKVEVGDAVELELVIPVDAG